MTNPLSRILAFWAPVFVLAFGAGCATNKPRSSNDISPSGSAASNEPELKGRTKALLLVDIANGALLEGDPTGALVHLEMAEREDNELPELYHSRALAYYAKKELKLAITAAERAVKLRPDYSDALNTLGKLRFDAGQFDAAIPPLKQAASDQLYPDAYKAYTNLGMLYYRKNELATSEQYLDRAITANPTRACIAYYYKGHIHLKQRKPGAAERDYALASKRQCAGFVDAHFALGVAYEQSRKFDLARRKFVEIQSQHPNTAFAEQAVARLKRLP